MNQENGRAGMKTNDLNDSKGLLILFSFILLAAIAYKASTIYKTSSKNRYEGFVIK
jgi:hypothetical protein